MRIEGLGSVQPLHPTLLSEDSLRPYLPEFQVALSDPEITNIAISGPYGSGKSTLVDSWEEMVWEDGNAYNSKKSSPWVHISLAGFADEKEDPEDRTAQGRDVESELTNQLIFKLGRGNTPKGRFAITEDGSPLGDLTKALCWLGLLTLAVLVVSGWNSDSLPWSNSLLLSILSVALLLCLVPVFYKGVRSQAIRKTLKRMKLFNAEVEVFNRDTDPAFNRYMDDVVYLLTNSKSSVFVFEDLDRFQNVSLFEKLRRVNELANDRRRRTHGRTLLGHKEPSNPVRFIYLVHDSLFSNPKDRTKFFDLVIPVIPYVDPSNSADILIQGLKKAGIEASETFLYQLSLYIDDSRILKDICNECRHYKQSLVGDDWQPKYWDDNKLVGMMAYKALFPQDFECLQVRDGFIFSIFESKNDLIAEKIQDVRSEIERLKNQAIEIERAGALAAREVELIGVMRNQQARNVLGRQLQNLWGEFASEQEFFNAIENDEPTKQKIDSTVSELKETDPNFKRRLEIAAADKSEYVGKINSNIEKLEQNIVKTAGQTLSELLKSPKISEELFATRNQNEGEKSSHIEGLKKSKYFAMLRFLLVQGYIDETYPLYTSNRYNGSLTINDERFLFGLLGSYEMDPNYKLDDPDAVLLRVDSDLLARKSARNYCLFSAILLLHSRDKASAFLRGAAAENDDKFVLGYILSEQLNINAYDALAEWYPSCVSQVISDSEIQLSERRAFCKRMLSSMASRVLLELSKDTVADFTSKDPLFLESSDVLDQETFEISLAWLGYRASEIDFARASQSLLQFVSISGMFERKAAIVRGLVANACGVTALAYVQLNNYLATSDDETVISIRRRIFGDMDEYISTLLEECSASLMDEDEAVAMALNSESLTSEEVATKYISALSNEVKKLNLIKSVRWTTIILSQGKCSNTTENICTYLNALGEDTTGSALSSYLNIKGVSVDLSPDSMNNNGVDPNDFIRAYAPMMSGLDDGLLRAIAEKCKGASTDIDFTGIEPGRIKILIEAGYIRVNKRNLDELRRIDQHLAESLAMTDVDAYADLVLDHEGKSAVCEFANDEVIALLGTIKSRSTALVDLIGGLTQKIALSDSYPDKINAELIEKKKFNGDIEDLLMVYARAGKELRRVIARYVGELDVARAESVFAHLSSFGDSAIAKSFLTEYLSCSNSLPERSVLAKYAKVAGLEAYASLIDASKRSVSVELSKEDDALADVLYSLGLTGKSLEANGKRRIYSKH